MMDTSCPPYRACPFNPERHSASAKLREIFSNFPPSREKEARSTSSTAVLHSARPANPFWLAVGPGFSRFTIWAVHYSPPISTTLCQSIRHPANRSVVGSLQPEHTPQQAQDGTHGRVVFLSSALLKTDGMGTEKKQRRCKSET